MTRCILFLLVFFNSSIFSQTTFVHSVGTIYADFGYSCSPAFGGGSVVAVLKGLDSLARIVFVDSSGFMTGYKNILVDNYCTPATVLQTANEGYVLLLQISDSSYSYNNSLALYFTDLSGDYRSVKQYSFSKNDIPCNLVRRKAGGFICFSEGVSNSGSAFTVVTAVNDTGKIIWSNQYTAPFGLPCVKGAEMPDSNICFVAKLSDPFFPSSRTDVAVTMLDRNGNVLWSRVYRTTYEDDPHSMSVNDSSEIFITGMSAFVGRGADCFILRLDRNGNLIHSRLFDGATSNGETPRCIISANDGSAVVMGEMGSVGAFYIFLLNIDSTSSLLSAHSYTFSTTYNEAWDMYRTEDDGIFFTGWVQSPSPSGALMVKTEADGNLNCYMGTPQITEYNDIYQDTVTIVTKSPSMVVNRNYSVSAPVSPINDFVICALSTGFNLQLMSDGLADSVYPNPTNGIVNVKSSQPDCEFSIYDILGRMVLKKKSTKDLSQIDLSSYPDGVYYLLIHSKEIQCARLIIKE